MSQTLEVTLAYNTKYVMQSKKINYRTKNNYCDTKSKSITNIYTHLVQQKLL